MYSLIILIFLLAALLGITLFSYILRNKNTPKGLAMIHGGIAAVGIFLILILILTDSVTPYTSFILFILAALGGFTLFYRDIIGKPLPKWVAAGHGVVAVIAFIFLILSFIY